MSVAPVAALLLCHYAGKDVSAENVKKILDSVGASAQQPVIDQLVKACEGKSVNEIIEAGMGKLVAAAAATVATTQAAAPAAEKAEEKKEEPKKEEEEEDDDMGFSLFD